MPPLCVAIMGAAGRDFLNFNVSFRGNLAYAVVPFTAVQIPNLEGCTYPLVLAASAYPAGIPIYPETHLVGLIPIPLNTETVASSVRKRDPGRTSRQGSPLPAR
jgi:predicted GTPase